MTCFLKKYFFSCFYFWRVLLVITNLPLYDYSTPPIHTYPPIHFIKIAWPQKVLEVSSIPHTHCSRGMMPYWFFEVFSTEISHCHQCVTPRQKLVVVNNNMTSLDVTQPSSNVALSVLDLSPHRVSNSALTIKSPIFGDREDPFPSLLYLV